nr:aminotransferase class I/II-fold pyridoxal phosphate-dependent enzyme [Nocardioides alcanivorans]
MDGELIGVATSTVHASYLHVHWAGQPLHAQRFAEAAAAAAPIAARTAAVTVIPRDVVPDPAVTQPLLHHGDRETGGGLVDFAVNVHPEPRPAWLEQALRDGVRRSTAYPDVTPAREAIAELHHRRPDEVLVTAGAAEAFELVARWKPWRHAVVVHPQFTEPHAALERAGHQVSVVQCRAEDGYRLDPAAVPEDADLVVLGNPTNPTGVLHPRRTSSRCAGRSGSSWSTRRSWTQWVPTTRRWPVTVGVDCWWCAASPSTGRSPASARATCSATTGRSQVWAPSRSLVGLDPGDRGHRCLRQWGGAVRRSSPGRATGAVAGRGDS